MPDREPTSSSVAGSVARCRSLGVDYRSATGVAAALIDVDASFERGRLSVIAGASGSGKSTLLRVLAGLQRATTGSVEVAGVELNRMGGARRRRLRRRTMGVVLQDPADNLVEYLRAVEQIELAARLRGVDRREAGELLEAIGLAHLSGRVPAELSGGEQQRIAFAAAAVGRPSVLLADEPTAELDAAAGTALIATMRELVEHGASLIVTSHDAAVIAAADRFLTLADGRVVT